ncbi:hypothetical protein CSHISOI_02716 [Colletotrichum shisoi]|uniref:Uncharacterized protein n=1 Tax=Colletotrichum shisoi TaxID=2078593 RepID=A0A5Q4C2H9_9PEZI|nr:hypothetical protein CSHISOI_02716 [Colletotrichum shisoi]
MSMATVRQCKARGGTYRLPAVGSGETGAAAAHPLFLRLLLIHPPFNFPWRNASTTLGRLSPTDDHLTPRLYTTTLFVRTESAVSQGPGKLGCEEERLTHASPAGLPNADVPLERLSRSQTQSSLAHGASRTLRSGAMPLACGVRLQYMAPTDVVFAHHLAISMISHQAKEHR